MKDSVKKYKLKLLILLHNKSLYCYLCGNLILSEDDFSLDHVHPKSKGGPTEPGNLLPAHKKCNCEKGNMSLKKYRSLKSKEK